MKFFKETMYAKWWECTKCNRIFCITNEPQARSISSQKELDNHTCPLYVWKDGVYPWRHGMKIWEYYTDYQ